MLARVLELELDRNVGRSWCHADPHTGVATHRRAVAGMTGEQPHVRPDGVHHCLVLNIDTVRGRVSWRAPAAPTAVVKEPDPSSYSSHPR